MSFKAIGQNSAARITLRGPQDGTPTALGTPATLNMVLVKSIDTNETTTTADGPGLGDGTDVIQVLRTGHETTFEFYVPDTGAMFKGKIGYYAQVDLKDLVTDADWDDPYEGVITARSISKPDGYQIEKITIRGGANGLV